MVLCIRLLQQTLQQVWNWFQFRRVKQAAMLKVKVKADIALHGNTISELWDVTCHMGSHSVTCHPTQLNGEHAPPNPSHAGWYSIYLPRRHGRLSWPTWLDSTPAGSRTSDLLITSLMPNRCKANYYTVWIWSASTASYYPCACVCVCYIFYVVDITHASSQWVYTRVL